MALAGGLRRSFASHVHESLDRALPPPEPGDSRPPFIPAPPGRDRLWVHTLLFVLTIASTTAVGALHYFFFRRGFSGESLGTGRLRRLVVLSAGALVQRHRADHPGLSRDGALRRLPPLPRRCLAPLLPARAVPQRHAGRVHPHSRAHPVEDRVVRHRSRRPHRGLRGRRSGAVHGACAVGRRTRPGGLHRLRARRTAALPLRGVADLGRPSRQHVDQHAPDGVRVVVRTAGDGAQPLSDGPARRRPRHLRHPRTPIEHHHHRHRAARDRPLIRVGELVGLDRSDGRDAVLDGPASSADAGRRHADRSDTVDPGRRRSGDVDRLFHARADRGVRGGDGGLHSEQGC